MPEVNVEAALFGRANQAQMDALGDVAIDVYVAA